ncbi:MAG: glycosyltransferase family 9 protein [Ignavibacteria bacterium]|nr:glycosyltransferase family 9 protein [Ignavibacteria bacterium]
MKILVVRLSSFGDIVLTFPFINELRRLYPDSEITFLTKPQYAEAAGLHPYINKIITLNPEIRKQIKNSGFDVIFDLQKNQRTLLMLMFSDSMVFRVKKDTMKKRILAVFKINLLRSAPPVYKRYLLALKRFKNDASGEYTVTTDLKCDEYTGEKVYMVVSPSSKHFTKRYPKEKFLEILQGINKTIILTGDNNETDRDVCGYLESKLSNTMNMCGKSSFGKLAGLIKNSQMVVCNDSGVLHLAEALGKKTIVFFGSTVKEFGFYPQLKSTVIYENKGLKCRPCTHIGRQDCPKGHFKCMIDIDTKGIKNLLN